MHLKQNQKYLLISITTFIKWKLSIIVILMFKKDSIVVFVRLLYKIQVLLVLDKDKNT